MRVEQRRVDHKEQETSYYSLLQCSEEMRKEEEVEKTSLYNLKNECFMLE